MIKSFKEDPDVKVFLISLKAGGVALNLTVASRIFIMGTTHKLSFIILCMYVHVCNFTLTNLKYMYECMYVCMYVCVYFYVIFY